MATMPNLTLDPEAFERFRESVRIAMKPVLDGLRAASERLEHAEHDCFLMDCAKERPDAEADGYSWPTLEQDAPASVALEAHAAVYGDRQDDYGHPREDFTRTAIIWTGLLQHKLADGEFIEAEDIARCQIGVKLARDVHAPKRDNRVDMAGYAITLDRLESGR